MTTELNQLKQKVAEAVARRDAAVESWKYADSTNSSPRAVTAFHKAHPTDIETMQALLVRLEALEAENNPALAVLKHIVEDRCEEPLAFIEAWYEGNFDALREEWENVPDAVFDGADPLFKRNSNDQN